MTTSESAAASPVCAADFLAFAAEVFGVPPETLSLATAYESIPAWDSVAHVRLVMEIAERYGVEIPLAHVPELHTLADCLACLG